MPHALTGERLPLPGSPFTIHVVPGSASAEESIVDGFIVDEVRSVDKAKERPSRAFVGLASHETDVSEKRAFAGDTIIVRPLIHDCHGNPTHVLEGTLSATLVNPLGIEEPLVISSTTKGGLTHHEVHHEATTSGDHAVHVRLHNESGECIEIKGSPVEYVVHPGALDVTHAIIERSTAEQVGCAACQRVKLLYMHMVEKHVPSWHRHTALVHLKGPNLMYVSYAHTTR